MREDGRSGGGAAGSGAGSVIEAAVAAFEADHGVGPGAPLAVVVPAFNEEAGVGDAVGQVPGTVCGLATEVIVVDDGSSDATALKAEAAGALVCRLVANAGQGTALRVGYALAARRGAAVIATTDADGQLDAAELPRLVAPLLDGRADFANGSRRLGSSHTDDRVRAAGVVWFGRLVTLLAGTPITDPANGLRAWRREVTDVVRLRQPQYQTSELLLRTVAAGFRVLEVPVTVLPRSAGTTKKGANLRYGCRFARVVLTTAWQERDGLWRARRGQRGPRRPGG